MLWFHLFFESESCLKMILIWRKKGSNDECVTNNFQANLSNEILPFLSKFSKISNSEFQLKFKKFSSLPNFQSSPMVQKKDEINFNLTESVENSHLFGHFTHFTSSTKSNISGVCQHLKIYLIHHRFIFIFVNFMRKRRTNESKRKTEISTCTAGARLQHFSSSFSQTKETTIKLLSFSSTYLMCICFE